MSDEVAEKVQNLEIKEESASAAPAEVILGPDGQPLSKKALKKLEKEKEKEKKKAERAAQIAAEEAARAESAAANDTAKDNYGKLPLMRSENSAVTGIERIKFNTLSADDAEKEVVFRALI
ncbi:unnamed protein product [[Candida] boidinii]|nr:unnamed protein product [[Candida] boidinii]